MIKPMLLLFTFILASLWHTNANSEPQFRGYISQGIIVSDDNPLYGIDSGVSLDFREIALNGTWQIHPRFRIAGQLLSRRAGELEDGDPQVDFFLADYNFFLTDRNSAGIRFGKVKNQYGLYNSTRDVPHVRPGVFVPQSIYFESFRDPLLSIIGGNAYFEGTNSFSTINVDIYTGTTNIENRAIEYQVYQKDIKGNFDNVKVNGMKIGMTPTAIPELSLSLSLLDINLELESTPQFNQMEMFLGFVDLQANPQNFSNYLTNTKIEPFITLLSLQYDWKKWTFTTELLEIETDISDVEILHMPGQAFTTTSRAYYLQAEWFALDKLSFLLRYEELYYNKDDKDGSNFAAKVGGAPENQYNKAITFGGRWYITQNFSVTGEISHNTGAAFINGPDNVDYSELNKKWDLFIAQISYHF